MSYILLPALVALLVKVGVLGLSIKANSESKFFVPVVLFFAAHNVCEVLVLWDFLNGVDGFMIIKAYYVLTVLGWLATYLYANEISQIGSPKTKMLVICASFVLIATIMFSGFIVQGSVQSKYALTAIRGDFYWLWLTFCVFLAYSVSVSLWAGYKNAKDHLSEIRCAYVGIAIAPVVLICCLLAFLIAIGFKVTAVISVPVTTTLFLMIMLASEYQHKLTDIRRFIPWSNERKSSRKIMEIFSSYSRDDIEYRQAVSEIERLLVLQKYDKNAGNASETAGKMGMPRSSLYSIFNRLGIESRGDKHSS